MVEFLSTLRVAEKESIRNQDGFISGTSESDNDDYITHSKKSLNFKQRKSRWVSVCFVRIMGNLLSYIEHKFFAAETFFEQSICKNTKTKWFSLRDGGWCA